MVSQNPDELGAELEVIEFDGSPRTLAVLRSEANLTVERQLDTLADIDDKASRMLRLNLLTVGVILSALSIASQLDGGARTGLTVIGGFRNVYVEVGVASLVLSSALAAITYSASENDGGVSAENVTRLLRTDLPLEDAEVLLVKNYVARINFNRSSNVRNIPLITGTIVLAVVGVILLTLGVYQATVRPVPWWLATAAIAMTSTVVFVSGVLTQTGRAIADIRAWR